MSISELLAIYTSQTMGNTSIPRFATYSTDDLKIASYFGGDSNRDMAILLLNEHENPTDFRDALIKFYHTVANGEERKENLERKFEELFSIVQEHHEQNQAQFKSLEDRFDTYFNMLRDFIQVFDTRLTQLENNILKLLSSTRMGEKAGS